MVILAVTPPDALDTWLKFILTVSAVVAVIAGLIRWGISKVIKAVTSSIEANSNSDIKSELTLQQVLDQLTKSEQLPGAYHKSTLRDEIVDIRKEQETIKRELEKVGERDRDQLALIIAVSHRPILMIDGDLGMVLAANHEAENFFGWRTGQLSHVNIDMLIPERFRARHTRYREVYMKAPTPRMMAQDRDFTALHKSGREIECQISLYPLEHSEGIVLAWVTDKGDTPPIL